MADINPISICDASFFINYMEYLIYPENEPWKI